MKTSVPTIILRLISIPVQAMPIIPTSKNMVLKLVVAVVGAVPVKPSVKPFRCHRETYSHFCTAMCQGRVAAGAIAEKYLKIAYGIEIVAFVSSVGKVHLPASLAPPSLVPSDNQEDNDEVEDVISPEFRQFLASVTREEVDKYPTRCPHESTSERMIQVR
jgi:hypothetical protein